MTSILVRNVPDGDLDLLRSAAAGQGVSLQVYLLDTVHAQAAHIRRRQSLSNITERLNGQPVPDEERDAVLDAVEDAHVERGDRLIDRPAT